MPSDAPHGTNAHLQSKTMVGKHTDLLNPHRIYSGKEAEADRSIRAVEGSGKSSVGGFQSDSEGQLSRWI